MSLESLTTFFSQQCEGLLNLCKSHVFWFNASDPLGQDSSQAIDLDKCVISRDYKYSIYINNVEAMF